MNTRIVFRTDSSTAIGTGHLSRCLALAGALRSGGADTAFVCRHLSAASAAHIESQGHRLLRLNGAEGKEERIASATHSAWLGTDWQTDAQETVAILAASGSLPDWLVIDHYALDTRWEGALRKTAKHILVIDDLADRDHDCDVLLDQNFHDLPELRYRHRVGRDCRLLLGPSYALLRPEFVEARGSGNTRDGEPKRILVFMGGIDALDHTRNVISGFLDLGRNDLKLEVVIGGNNPHRISLTKAFGGHPEIELQTDVSDMAQRLRRADIAVGAGGVAMWERCCLALPSVTLAVAENQEPGAQSLGRYGATLYLGPAAQVDASTIRGALAVLLAAKTLRHALAARAGELVDGRGAIRVTRLLLGGPLSLRLVLPSDREPMLAWRNDERTRRYSMDDSIVSAADHARWFCNVLADPSRKLLIAEEGGCPVGVLRFDIKGNEVEISLYLVPGQSGRGIGTRLLSAGEAWLTESNPEIQTLLARVREDNAASLRLFQAAGFERDVAIFRKRVNSNA